MNIEQRILVSNPADGVRMITFNRPEAHNAIDMAMADELLLQLDAAEADPAVRCLVLTGAGEKAFSAGFDIREMARFDAAAMRDAFGRRDPLTLHIAQHRLPIIAALNGLAYGAGALIAAACDLRIASERATFKVTAINYGSANATWSLPRLVGTAAAKDILMTGRAVSSEEGYRIGLFNRITTDATLLDSAIALASEIAGKQPDGVMAIKALVNASQGASIEEGWRAEHEAMLEAFGELNHSGAMVFEGFLAGARPSHSQ
ncbi:MAG: enoyl-CoA hydratase/isomerase family protein [Sphingomonadales bacterium]|nr:enoyl-CoA hydratase/isomerase family protein [Sphingomonadales bacterium]